jgi:ADP-heptose:LPS heptosyltransferase
MNTNPFQNQHPRTILVFRALVLGDMLCTVPAFRALRHHFPSSHIALVGLPWAKSFVERFSDYFDEFIEFPGFPGLPETKPNIHRFPAFIRYVQKRRFDLALQMHGSGSYVNSITMLLGARVSAGFCEKDYCPSPDWFMPWPHDDHEIHIFKRLMDFLSIPWAGDDLEFPISPKDVKDALGAEGVKRFINESYVCIHAGARLLTRRWMPERFAQVANALASYGFKIVLTGSEEERELVDEVSRRIHFAHYNLAGKTSVGALAWILKNSQLLISNDTGVSHIAAALKVPSVIVVSGSDPRRWAPLDKRLHLISSHDVSCRPCSFERCPVGLLCAQGVTAEDVLGQAFTLLNMKDKPQIAVRTKL